MECICDEGWQGMFCDKGKIDIGIYKTARGKSLLESWGTTLLLD